MCVGADKRSNCGSGWRAARACRIVETRLQLNAIRYTDTREDFQICFSVGSLRFLTFMELGGDFARRGIRGSSDDSSFDLGRDNWQRAKLRTYTRPSGGLGI